MIVESDPKSKLDEIPPGSRIFVVEIYDPRMAGHVAGGTVIHPEDLDNIDEKCQELKVPYRIGLQRAAVEQIFDRMFAGKPPHGIRIEQVVEVSQRELREMVEASEKQLEQELSSKEGVS